MGVEGTTKVIGVAGTTLLVVVVGGNDLTILLPAVTTVIPIRYIIAAARTIPITNVMKKHIPQYCEDQFGLNIHTMSAIKHHRPNNPFNMDNTIHNINNFRFVSIENAIVICHIYLFK